MTSSILAEARGRLGVITLDRQHGLNTLNHSMITAMADAFAVGLSESHVPSTALPEPAATLESEQPEVAFAADTVPELLADTRAPEHDLIQEYLTFPAST